MPVKIVQKASEEPLTFEDAKKHLNLDDDEDQELVEELIAVAREEVEQLTGRQLVAATLEAYFDRFPWLIELSRSPVTEVVSIKYVAPDRTEQTVDPARYLVDAVAEPARILPAPGQCWPQTACVPNAVIVQFKAGDVAADVPASIRQWMKLRIGTLYAHRESVLAGVKPETLPFVDRLLDRHKVWGG